MCSSLQVLLLLAELQGSLTCLATFESIHDMGSD